MTGRMIQNPVISVVILLALQPGIYSMEKPVLTSAEQRITNQFGNIIRKFNILYSGWEMDGVGYVVCKENKNKIIVTDHGNPMEVSSKYLKIKIKEYEDTIKETKNIINFLENV